MGFSDHFHLSVITSEAKENLAVLKVAVLHVLEAQQEVSKPNPFKKPDIVNS